MHREWRAVVLAGSLLQALPVAALQAVGTAVDAENGELRYREYHSCEPGNVDCSVEYREPGGELIARKQLDYSAAPSAPSLLFEDRRLGERIAVDAENFPEGVVIDAGFDNFVREKWPVLAAGKPVTFRFLPAGRDSALAMLAWADEQADCPAERLCLNVRPKNWLVALVGGELQLVYSRAARRLLEYRGVSNIPAADGAAQNVVIRYEYAVAAP
ncbi:hypothetical protein [Haliea sp. E17]|uniref:hypothetical protein n=1 Tax=Haliea sp. E17 TaxID=3401576 RepID=UPI003AAE971D